MNSYQVQVTAVDAAANKLAQTTVSVSAVTPGNACERAWVVMKEDLKLAGKKLPQIEAVHFLVRKPKGEKHE